MRSAACLTVLCALALAGEARACSVPVFRYALERWKPSPYPVHVFHRGPLTESQKATLAKLEDPAVPVNLKLSVVDLDDAEAEAKTLWEKHGKDKALPFVVVAYPEAAETQAPAWTGSLDDKALAALLGSPARRQVAKLLMRGETAVWVLLESGDKKADDDAAKLLEKELARLQKEIELPEQPEEGSMLLTDLPLKVSFAIVRLDRTKPEEAAFVRMLLDSEEDLDKAKGPIVLPIFGRGRVLVGLEGDSLTAKEITSSAKFLCGACSCRVKELNPGMDVLLTADWDALVETAGAENRSERTPPLTPEKPPAPTIPPGITAADESLSPQESEAKPRPCHCWFYSGAVAGLAVVFAGGGWVLWRRRSRS
jgi:hypothetical protein